MPATIDPPKRRWKLIIDIGADSVEELRHAFDGIEIDLFSNGCTSSTGGGCGAGWHFELVEQNPEMTPEKYRDGLEAYLQSFR